MNRDFEDIIKKKMDGFSKEAPDSVWEKIEKDMNRPKLKPANNHKKTISLVAATLAAASLAGLLFYTSTPDSTQLPMTDTVTVSENMAQPLPDNSTAPTEKEIQQTAGKDYTAKPAYTLAAAQIQKADADTEAAPAATPQALQQEAAVKAEEKIEEKAPAIETQARNTYSEAAQTQPAYRKAERQAQSETVRRQKSGKEGWSISFSADGTNGEYSKQTSGFIPTLSNTYNATKVNAYSDMADISNSSVSNVKHHMPVTASVTLTKNIWKGLSVETGVQYTMLKSDITTRGKSRHNAQQRLQYLGIPVKMNYAFLKINDFSAYASAGACLEKCISGNVDYKYMPDNEPQSSYSEKIAIKQLQYSVLASVGMKYNVTDFMGLYFEPGIAYFFDDGSEYDTYRKAHPLMLSLRVGVNFNF